MDAVICSIPLAMPTGVRPECKGCSLAVPTGMAMLTSSHLPSNVLQDPSQLFSLVAAGEGGMLQAVWPVALLSGGHHGQINFVAWWPGMSWRSC